MLAGRQIKRALVKVSDGKNGFETVAAIRLRRFAMGDGQARRAALVGQGRFIDAAADAYMRTSFFEGAIHRYQIVIPGLGTVQAPFEITGLLFAGERNGEVTYDVWMVSAGKVTLIGGPTAKERDMHVELGMKRGSKNRDPKLARIRRATSEASNKYGIGGLEKKTRGPKPVTLPKIEFREMKE